MPIEHPIRHTLVKGGLLVFVITALLHIFRQHVSFGPSDPSLQHVSEGFGLRTRPPSFSVQHTSFSLFFSANATQPRDDVEDPNRTPQTPSCFPATATSLSHLGDLPETPYRPLRLHTERQRACAKSSRIEEVAPWYLRATPTMSASSRFRTI